MSMLKSALEVASHGLRVFPVVPSTKVPRVTGWWADATIDPAKIVAWWTEFPTCSVGIACGHDGLIAIDIDGPEGANLWARTAAGRTAGTLTSISGSGDGLHRLFRLTDGQNVDLVPTRRGAIGGAKGIDVRAKNGQIVAPGSIHKSGVVYQWLNPTTPIAPMPDWLYEAIKVSAPRPETDASDREHCTDPPRERRIELARAHVRDFAAAVDGNDGSGRTIAAACAVVRGFDLDNEAGFEALDEFNARCVPPWSAKDLARKVSEAARIGTDPWGHLLEVGDMVAAFTDDAPIATATRGRIEWVFGDVADVELPPPNWIVPELQICPGRPTMIAGYGASGKTLIAQSLMLSCASGRPVWGMFATPKKFTVRHFDHDQGSYATRRRYQRLAKGLGVSLRELGTAFAFATQPNIGLTHKDAKRHYLDACAGADLILIDALRGAAQGADENDSRMREYVDVLAWVSEQLKAVAFILIHHAGKVAGEDKRMGPRGSSAIFDGCGCVLQIEAKDNEDAKTVYQTKSAAEAEGGIIQPFTLTIEDGAERALCIRHRAVTPPKTKDEHMAETRATVLAWLETHPGATKRSLRSGCDGGSEMKDWALEALLQSGEVVNRSADKKLFALFTRNNDRGNWV